ncbi:hypothetical protein [Martelella sp. AMO21009]
MVLSKPLMLKFFIFSSFLFLTLRELGDRANVPGFCRFAFETFLRAGQRFYPRSNPQLPARSQKYSAQSNCPAQPRENEEQPVLHDQSEPERCDGACRSAAGKGNNSRGGAVRCCIFSVLSEFESTVLMAVGYFHPVTRAELSKNFGKEVNRGTIGSLRNAALIASGPPAARCRFALRSGTRAFFAKLCTSTAIQPVDYRPTL